MKSESDRSVNTDEELFNLAIKLSSIEKLAESQHKRIDALYNSISWRITAPLRSSIRTVRKGLWYLRKSMSRRFAFLTKRDSCEFCGATLRDGFSHSFNDKTKAQGNAVDVSKLAIIIPVYGRIDSVKKLIASMKTDPEISKVAILFVDDRFDEKTSKWLTDNVNFPRSQVLKCPRNLGFGGAVNLAAENLPEEIEYAVLLNSDIELPNSWIHRFLQPFEDSKVGLATALATESGANLTVRAPKGFSWLDVDSFISEISPSYPAACTAIGYAMAIRLSAINRSKLFDPSYSDGYGEDSDLHYKVLSKGFASVVIDNLIVKHESGGSYRQKTDLEIFQKKNGDLFHSRWGDSYADEMFDWERTNPIEKIQCQVDRHFSALEIPCDVLLVVPTGTISSGGVRVAFELAEILQSRGQTVAVLTQSGGNEFNSGMTTIGEDDLDRLASPKFVLATGIGTFDLALSLARTSKSKLGVFLQGPEMYFSEGIYYRNFRRFMRNVDLIISISPFLSDVAKLHSSAVIQTIDYGPDSSVFYNASVKRERTIVVASRSEAEKGLWLALPYLELLMAADWKVKSFGSPSKILSQIEPIEQLGPLDPQGIADLFNSSSLYLDFSIFEGLGLVPLEAYFCGAIPVLTRKGAPETIFTGELSSSVIWLDSPTFSVAAANRLIGLSEDEMQEFRKNSNLAAELRNKDKGLDQAAGHIVEYLSKLSDGN